ncbi:hypothetical protein PGB90_009417 [Kerria lacca]
MWLVWQVDKAKLFYLFFWPASSNGNVWHPDALVARGNEILLFRAVDGIFTWVGAYLLLVISILSSVT